MKQNKTKTEREIRDHVELEWNGRNTIAKNERNDGERKEKTREKNYNSQYCWPAAAVQFESDGVVGRANVCVRARERSLGRWASSVMEGKGESATVLCTLLYIYSNRFY